MTEHTPKQIALATLADELEALAANRHGDGSIVIGTTQKMARLVAANLDQILTALRAMENNDAG